MPRMVVPAPDKTGKNNCRPPGILSVADQAMDIRCEQTYKRLDEHLEEWHSRLNRLTKAGPLAVAVFAIAGGFAGTILAQAGSRFLDWV